MQIQHNSATVEAKARYSVSMEDQETIACFLADQVIGQLPKKTTIPVMDLRLTRSPTQSTSLYADKVEGPRVKARP